MSFNHYILAGSFKRLAAKYPALKLRPEDYKPGYHIAPGGQSLVIMGSQAEGHFFNFGLQEGNSPVPFVRAEGSRNKDNNADYCGANAVFMEKRYRHLVRYQRCLVPADAFVAGIENNKPYLVYLRNKKRPFAFAGIWQVANHRETGEAVNSFAILTITANPLLAHLGLKRMPVILSEHGESLWLKLSAPLSEVVGLLARYPAGLMNAYPVQPIPFGKQANDASVLMPAGMPVYPEQQFEPLQKKKKRIIASVRPMLSERRKTEDPASD